MSILRSSTESEQLFTCNEAAEVAGMSWAGLSKWLSTRPRYLPKYVLEMGKNSVQLWDVTTLNAILNERDMG